MTIGDVVHASGVRRNRAGVTRDMHGGVAVDIGEPEELALWTPDLKRELIETLEALSVEPAAWAAELISRGRAFCAGAQHLGSRGLASTSRSIASLPRSSSAV